MDSREKELINEIIVIVPLLLLMIRDVMHSLKYFKTTTNLITWQSLDDFHCHIANTMELILFKLGLCLPQNVQ